MQISSKGVMALIAGTTIMLVIGSIYTFGNLSVYIASYLNYHGSPGIKVTTVSLAFPLSSLFMNTGIILG